MAPKFGRRFLIGTGASAALGVPFAVWFARFRDPDPRVGAFGALRPDPAGVLDLLEGFSYRVIDRVGTSMNDGFAVPPRPDGMACFEGEDGAIVLVRNHELPPRSNAIEWPDVAYDRAAGGAVTRVVLDAETLEVRSRNLLLAGTSMNCSGGPSPWGWLSCEEDAESSGHGFVFLCDPAAEAAREPVRIDGYGRFRHEAAAVHPETGICYLTEDKHDSSLYRFVPHDPSSPFEGHLQALKVRGRSAENTTPFRSRTRREFEWMDLRDTTPDVDDLRHRAQAGGAAVFDRGEGICFADGATHFCASAGGPIRAGQIFRLEDEGDGGTLEVVAASEDRAVMDMPDNITMGPGGTLYFVEDGGGHDLVRVAHSDGSILALGRNARSEGEICGVCFDPSERTMFINLQEDGLTLAVQGPFADLA